MVEKKKMKKEKKWKLGTTNAKITYTFIRNVRLRIGSVQRGFYIYQTLTDGLIRL